MLLQDLLSVIKNLDLEIAIEKYLDRDLNNERQYYHDSTYKIRDIPQEYSYWLIDEIDYMYDIMILKIRENN